MNTYLALDGPLNGSYITEAQAKDNGYTLSEWSTGETVWLHGCSPLTEDEAFPEPVTS